MLSVHNINVYFMFSNFFNNLNWIKCFQKLTNSLNGIKYEEKTLKNLTYLVRVNCNWGINFFIHFDILVYFNLTFCVIFHVKFTEAKHYHAKLVNIRKEMLMLHEKTSKLKVSWKLYHILYKSRGLITCFS